MDAVAAQRVALCVEYDGTAFSGWQAQLSPALKTVQESLEAVLSRIADHPVRLICAGRTDAGVHGSGQVVHFDARFERPLKAWVRGANSMLPDSIAVHWAQAVPDTFHARFSAQSRRYLYSISNAPVRRAMLAGRVSLHREPLDAERMHAAGQLLLGERDFSAFRGAGCQSRTPMREVQRLQVQRYGDLVLIDIEANAFLLHMVRNITGVLLAIGDGRRPVDWAAEVLEGRDRTRAAATAPPDGLCLYQVRYPEHFNLPPPPPYFLPIPLNR